MTKEKRIIPGTFDPIFKAIFTSPDCRSYVCSVLSGITGIDEGSLKKHLRVEDTSIGKERMREKEKVTDVILSTEGLLINIEMNKDYYDGLFKKNDIYQHALIGRSMKKGESYNDIKMVIQINFNLFNKFEKEISKFMLMEVDTHEIENNYVKF